MTTTAIIHPYQARTQARGAWACASLGTRRGWASGAFWAAQAASYALQAVVMDQRPGLLWDPDPVTTAAVNHMARETGR